jgi:tRNA 2-selenouridine synthase
LPILDNEERAKVGTLYKQVSPFEARKLGAALVAKNISRHLTDYFVNKNLQYRPLIYCWRGGQRSNSLALVLHQIGWKAKVLEGGYKTYRTYVRDRLSKLSLEFNYKIICGLTGTGKTHILQQLRLRGEQVLDLEAIANHRGSLLGEEWQGKALSQPSQKYFESLLLAQLQDFNVDRIVWIESESCKIGCLHLPPTLWEMMKRSDCIEIRLPLEARIIWLLQKYSHLIDRPDILKSKLTCLKSRYGWQKIKIWLDSIDSSQWEELVKNLLLEHYDPAYCHSFDRTYQKIKKSISIEGLSNEEMDSLCDLLLAIEDK